MWATIILVKINEDRVSNNLLPTAAGPLANKMKNIFTTRTVYATSLSPNQMHEFIAKFNNLNRFSMVAYPVGMYYDTFNENRESLVNKVPFTVSPKSQYFVLDGVAV